MMVKRLFDLIASSIGLLFLLPLFLLVALFIKADSLGPVFFRQVRVGQGFTLFRIFKFRTMVTDAEKRGALVSAGDDPRITRIGRVLRKYKLDELPQLINVVAGDMSLVGPRPEVPRYVEAYRKDYEEILKVKPGITDLASLEYIDESLLLSVAQNPEEKYLQEILPVKITHYREYILRQSLQLDVVIIFRTLLRIICKVS